MEIQLRSPCNDTDTTPNDEYLKLSKFIGRLCEAILKQQSPNISQESIQRTIGVIAKLVVRIIMNQGGSAGFSKEGRINKTHIDGIDSDSNLAQQINWISGFLESRHASVGQPMLASDNIQILEHGGIRLNLNVSHLTDSNINQLKLTIDSVANNLVLVFRSLFRREEDILKHRKEVIQDPLTGISRRAVFEDELMAGFLNSLKLNELGGVIMVDLNGFKSVNDTYGHDAGDAVLKHAANAMVDVLERVSGTIKYELDIPGITKDWIVCRLGGDEFVVILGSSFSGSSKATIESLRYAIAQPLLINGREVIIRQGASFGYSNSDPNSSYDSFSALLKKADHQMYNEKGGIWRSIRALITGALRK